MTMRWRQIPGSDYEVSDYGQVRKGKNLCREYILPTGYRSVWVKINGQWAQKYVHRLVLEIFVGPCLPGQECRHRDGDNGNNYWKNLKWGTPKENGQDKIKHGTAQNGELVPQSKLTWVQVRSIRKAQGPRGLGKKLAEQHGVSSATISLIRANKGWRE